MWAYDRSVILHIDHDVLTVRDTETSVEFFKRVLRVTESTFADGHRAIHFKNQKINLQRLGHETRNHAGIGTRAS